MGITTFNCRVGDERKRERVSEREREREGGGDRESKREVFIISILELQERQQRFR